MSRVSTNVRAFAILLGVAFCASPLLAQSEAGGTESGTETALEGEEIKGDTRVVDIREVERGFYFGVDIGPNYYFQINRPGFVQLNGDNYDPNNFRFNPGQRVSIRLGYDVLNNINVEMFVLANFNKGSLDPATIATGASSGDLSHFVPGIAARFAFVTTKRTYVYARVGAGYAFWVPQEVAGAFGSIHTEASIGVEYYTKLRHISIGAEFAGQALLNPYAFGIQIYPTLKYTF